MYVTGFSFIKNAIKYDFPIVESIRSILPLCDEVVIAVGDSSDDTRELVQSIDEKVRIIDTVWNESLIADGAVLADETNKAMAAIHPQTDWCVYIQGDEVMHEDDLMIVSDAMRDELSNKEVEALLFHYRHFYGSYDYLGSSSRWYRHEIRAFKYNPDIYSYRDAQGFRKKPNNKLKVRKIPAYIYHYGWVKPPEIMYSKVQNDLLVRHGIENSTIPTVSGSRSDFDYSAIDMLNRFEGSHPYVMKDRIQQNNWVFEYDLTHNKISVKQWIKKWSEKLLGYQIGEYRNYRLVK